MKKTVNTVNTYLMESSSHAHFHELRPEVKGGTSDQGTEAGIWRAPISVLPQFADTYRPGDYMQNLYPYILEMPGHLHILYNALQEAVESIEPSKDFIDCLRILEAFLSSRSLQCKFMVSCLAGVDGASMFMNHPVVHIDWRWGVHALLL